jgi:hypothetical protein
MKVGSWSDQLSGNVVEWWEMGKNRAVLYEMLGPIGEGGGGKTLDGKGKKPPPGKANL